MSWAWAPGQLLLYYGNQRAPPLYHACADCSFQGDSFAEVVVREGQGCRYRDKIKAVAIVIIILLLNLSSSIKVLCINMQALVITMATINIIDAWYSNTEKWTPIGSIE